MRNYETLSEAVNDLLKRGYSYNLLLKEDGLYLNENELLLKAEDFVIDEIYRFEGDTDPGDENVVYAVSSKSGTIKGIVVNAFGTYAESLPAEWIKKLKDHSDNHHVT